MEEYVRYDAEFYDAYVDKIIEDDIPFYVDFAKSTNGNMLEIGCGTGRILIPIAKAGIKISGIAFSADMLKIAKEKISKLEYEVQNQITLSQGDMRTFELDQ